MFINYHEKKHCNLISSKYQRTCSLPASSFSLPERNVNKGNENFPPKPGTSKSPTQHCWRRQHAGKALLSLAQASTIIFMNRKLWFSSATSQRRGGGQRRLCLQPGVSIHPCQYMPVSLNTPDVPDRMLWCPVAWLLGATTGTSRFLGWRWGWMLEGWCQVWHWGWWATQHQQARDGLSSGMCMASSSMQHTALLTWSAATIKLYL